MPTTSNFGWTTPADTDLVKDGAAAIRTLGNGIDTSLVDLKGGTTGQILSKNSNTDLDYTWINNDQGDLTAVTAGVGITVTNGTGPIPTITNSSTDLITTAGDILYGTAADTVARLGIGTAGQVLKVNSGATAPEWGAASSTPTFVGCDLRKTANQSISNSTVTALSFDSENFDTDGFHDNSTNNTRITIPAGKGGKYLFTYLVRFAGNNSGRRDLALQINGTQGANFMRVQVNSDSGLATIYNATCLLNLSAGDYVESIVIQTSGGALNVEYEAATQIAATTRFGCTYLGA
jgi:hypothetical protein